MRDKAKNSWMYYKKARHKDLDWNIANLIRVQRSYCRILTWFEAQKLLAEWMDDRYE